LDHRYVYILQRTGKSEAVLLIAIPMNNASKIEARMHEVFGDSRIKDITKEPYGMIWQFQSHVKIGIATSPQKRLEDINESNLRSGKTEWFRATWLELMVMMVWLYWFRFRMWFWIVIILSFTGLCFWIYDQNPVY
jgi:hypothetical protein